MKKSYKELQAELEQVIDQLQDESLDIDEAFKNHEKGQKLLTEIEAHLKSAENKLKKLAD